MAGFEKGSFFNNLCAFIISFLSIKSLLILIRVFIANLFGIDILLRNYSILGVSPANSAVWTKTSVILFYSSEIIVLLLLTVVFGILFYRNKAKFAYKKFLFLWFFVVSCLFFFSAIISGIVTRSNSYHFFNWMYVSYTLMLVVSIGVLFAATVSGLFLNTLFLNFGNPFRINTKSNIFRIETTWFNNVFFPICLGLILLYLPFARTIGKYEGIEIFIFLLFILFGSVHVLKYNKLNDYALVHHLNKSILKIAILVYVFLVLIIKSVFYW